MSDIDSTDELLQIRADILRSATLTSGIRTFAQFFFKQPCGLTDKTKVELYRRSKPCGDIGMFFSHAWRTPGWVKYTSLTVHHGLLRGCIAASALLVVLKILMTQGVIGGHGTHAKRTVNGEEEVTLFVWATVFSPLAGLIGVFGITVLPCGDYLIPDCIEPTCFLDCICIDQKDNTRMLEGIRSLGGFINKSRQFVILWTPPYFTRLWCVYELAVCTYLRKHVKGSNCQLRFSPTYLPLGCLGIYFTLWVNLSAWRLFKGSHGWKEMRKVWGDHELYILGVMLTSAPPIVLCIHWLRGVMRDKHEFRSQLKSFDAASAECSCADDRALVLESIAKLFGDVTEFNIHVRSMAQAEVGKLMTVGHLPWEYAVACGFPWLGVIVDDMSTLILHDSSVESIVSYCLSALATAFCALPLQARLFFWMAEYFSVQLGNRIQDFGKSTILGLDLVLVMFGTLLAEEHLHTTHIFLSVAHLLGGMALVWLAFRFSLDDLRFLRSYSKLSADFKSGEVQVVGARGRVALDHE